MTNYATQQQNDDMMSLIASQFRLLYNPTHAFADAITMLRMFPGLRGLWSSSVVGASGQMNDVSSNGLHLTNNNNPVFGNDGLAPYVEYNGSTSYHSLADTAALDILGTEAYIALPGLTMGAWVYPTRLTNYEAIIAKSDESLAGAYSLQLRGDAGGDPIQASITNGTIATGANGAAFTVNEWQFLHMKFIPSTSLSVSRNLVITTVATTIAALNNSASSLGVGRNSNAAGRYFDGRISLAFLCASAVPDIFINTFYQMTAPLFNVSI